MRCFRPDFPLRGKHLASQGAGFTLIEVLVALAVLALALAALQLRMSQHLESAAYLRDKTVANWVALNQLELLRIAQRLDAPPPAGYLEGRVSMGGREWYWAVTPQIVSAPADAGGIVPLSVSVSADSIEAARVSPLVSLTGVGHAWE